MASIADLIADQVKAAASGKNELTSNVISGLSDSVLNSLKQTATSKDGISQITSLLSGSTSASSSSITSLASSIFTSQFASKLGLSSSTTNLATSLLPTIISGIVSAVQKKSGGLDLSSVLSALGGSSSTASTLGKIAGSLGSLFGKK